MKYLLLLTALFTFASCSNDELSFSPLDGYHSLEQIGCYCPAIEVTPHQQQWSFDFDKMEIDVQTFGEMPAETPWLDFVLDKGVYSFEFLPEQVTELGDTVDVLEVDGRQYGFLQDGGTISLDSGTPFGIIDSDSYRFQEN